MTNTVSNTIQTRIQFQAEQQYEEILEQTTQIIECETGAAVHRDTASYMRFAAHLHSLLKRLFEEVYVDDSILQMYYAIRNKFQKISKCVDKISRYFRDAFSANLNKEEKLYLIMHISCVCCGETE